MTCDRVTPFLMSGQPTPMTTAVVTNPLTLVERLLTRNTGHLLFRDALASSFAFVLGLCLMWALVELLGVDELMAAGASFVAANALHYVFAQAWIYHGTRRSWGEGYGYFLLNAGGGLALTMMFFAACMRWTSMHYLVARTVVSVFAGLMMFALNATLNFKRV
jgi:putative flippase GtrA